MILVGLILLRSILGWNEHVADAADGADRIGMCRIGLDFAAEPGDAEVKIDIDKNLPNEDPSDYPSDTIVLEPPACASCYM